jgi:phosphate transport system ATP-binding protein
MESNAKIITKDLNLHVGKLQILKNVNIEIPPNKVTVILGPSGCGKTTLLKTMNRLTDLYPEMEITGNIFIDGKDILKAGTEITEIRRKMGLLSQRPYPLPMSIYKNIAFGLKINGTGRRKELDQKVEQYLRLANLWDEVKDRLREPANTLSIGQQQRLCLARGLAVDPEIILADEPTSALDPISSNAIEVQFAALKAQYTIVMVTHILRQARRIADHIIFMYLGEVVEQGPAAEFFNKPQMPRTKEYLKGAFN